jgi:hypothetical protein
LIEWNKYGFRQILFPIIGYGYGIVFNGIITYGLHNLVGEPRPHFFDSCRPDMAEVCVEG